MEEVLFCDGEKIGYFDGEKVTYRTSEYITRYREYAVQRTKNDEWKFGGEGARFRGDYEMYAARSEEKIYAYINGVRRDGDGIVYTFTVNGSSGIYRMSLLGENVRENHLLSSAEEEYLSLDLKPQDTLCAVTVRRNAVTSQIALFNPVCSELSTLTDGDSRDENVTFSRTEENILYFDSAGVGRDFEGKFTGKYAPSQILKLNTETLEITEVAGSDKLSFIKPKEGKDGSLYFIRRPNKERRGGNPLVEMLLIPVRIFQAIVMFVQFFVRIFTGKNLISDGESPAESGDNPAKGRKKNAYKLMVDGNLIRVDEELKRNKRFKDKEYGFIPHEWQLIRRRKDGTEEVLRCGVCDFSLTASGGIFCTDGRHVLYGKDGVWKKIADAEVCLCVSAE